MLGTARWASAAGQGRGAAAQGTACSTDGPGLGRAARATGTQAFVPWARAAPLQAPQEELSWQGLHLGSPSPLPGEAGRGCRFVTFVLAAPHIPLPHKQPRAPREGQALLCQAGLRAWPFCFPQPAQALLSIAVPCSEPLAPCNPGLKALLSPVPGEPLAVPALSGAQGCSKGLGVLLLTP